MGSLSITHWIIVLVVVVLIFGTKKLKNIGSDLGSAVKGFKDGIKDGDTAAPAASTTAEKTAAVNNNTTTTAAADNTIDVQAKQKQ